jgi:hypothetical protein
LRSELITEGATEKVSQLKIPLMSVYNTKIYVLMNHNLSLNIAKSFKPLKIFIITIASLKIGSVYLFGVALYELI